MSTTDQTTFPLKEHLGFTIEREPGVGRAGLEIDDRHMNPNEVVHGAVPFALMDTAMGAAVMTMVDEGNMCATIEIHTRFIRPAMSGRLEATATVISAGRKIIHLEAKTVDGSGKLVASATGSFAVFPIPNSTTLSPPTAG